MFRFSGSDLRSTLITHRSLLCPVLKPPPPSGTPPLQGGELFLQFYYCFLVCSLPHLSSLTSHLSPLTSHLSPLTAHLSPLYALRSTLYALRFTLLNTHFTSYSAITFPLISFTTALIFLLSTITSAKERCELTRTG